MSQESLGVSRAVITGNLDDRIVTHPETHGWFVGRFMQQYPDFFSTEVELKWGRHKKGDRWQGRFATFPARTVIILITGKFHHTFTSIGQEVTLSQLGDFLMYDASCSEHICEALEDSLVLAIRCPSRPLA